MAAKVHLDYAVLERIAKGPGADRAVKDLAEGIAQKVRDQNIPVGDVDDSNGMSTTISLPVIVSDAGNVIIAHPAGIAVQAKYGALTKGAAAVGVEVHG
jgi:hypothetical protein